VILASPERIDAVRRAAADLSADILDLTSAVASVPAPTHEEAARADVIESLLRAEGLQTARDAMGNVVATIPGKLTPAAGANRLLVAAHLDTVFAHETPLEIARDGARLIGPGIGDNSLAIAAAVKLATLMRCAGETPAVDIVVTGNVGEEGLGNLRGIREVLSQRPDVGAVIALEGHTLGRVTHVAVGSRRYRITATGPGGHSWGDFGRPNAIHGLAKVISELDAIPLPRSPKTTLNVGMISGGVSVNTISPSATCLVDLRSTDESALRRLSERVVRVVEKNDRSDSLTLELESIGERPAGVVSIESPIVKVAARSLQLLGIEPSYDASSTDANVPIAAGLPAICIGITSGGNVHRTDEYIETEPVATGLAQFVLTSLAVSELLAAKAI
jgi:tripeptide aminopeptidase